MQELAPLAAVCDPSTKVIIIGLYNDIPLYRDLIRNGISEYIVSPVAMSDVLSAIAQIFVDPDAEPLGPQHCLHRRQGRRRFIDACA